MSSIQTVALVAQTNNTANWIRNHLPQEWLKPDRDIITAEEINKESQERTLLYVARQVAGIPPLLIAPSAYFCSGLVGGVLSMATAFGINLRYPARDSIGKNWKDWFEGTVILKPKVAKIEKTCEGVTAVVVFVTSFFNAEGNAIYSGFTTGAGFGWSAGRWLAQKVRHIHVNPKMREAIILDGSYYECTSNMVQTV